MMYYSVWIGVESGPPVLFCTVASEAEATRIGDRLVQTGSAGAFVTRERVRDEPIGKVRE